MAASVDDVLACTLDSLKTELMHTSQSSPLEQAALAGFSSGSYSPAADSPLGPESPVVARAWVDPDQALYSDTEGV